MASSENSSKDFKDNVPRRTGWCILPTLDGYVLREFMIPLSVLIMGFILLFVIGDIFNDLKDFLEKDSTATVQTMLKYFLLLMPGNIRFILPISVLLACMYTMANFGRHAEVTAMRASGISLLRCGGSIYMVGLIITGINFWFNERLVPDCERESVILKKTATNPDFKYEYLNMLTYRSNDKQRTWLFKCFDVDGVQKEVILKKYRADNTLDWDIQAKEAKFIPAKGWEFYDVELTPYDKKGFMPGSPKKFDVLKKSIEEIPDVPYEIMNAVKAPEDLPSWVILGILNKTKNMAQNCKNVYSTVFYSRMAFPWACFLAVFLGIPLAARNERGGIFKAIITAVAVIIIYQLVSHIFVILGKQGYLNSMLAGLAPTFAFIIYGWYNIRKA